MKRKLLIVDDDPAIQRLLKRLFRDEAVEIISAFDGKEALEAIEHEKPDLMLLDISMPNIDGVGVLQALKDAPGRIPTVMITANAEEETALRTMQLGAYDYVGRPFDISYLRNSVMCGLFLCE